MSFFLIEYYNMIKIGGLIVTDTNNQFLYKIQYLSYFVARAFLLAIFGLLILLALFFTIYFADLFINVKSGNYKNPIFGGYVIVSPSMVPTININDAIVIKRSSNNQYNVGDIISFYSTEYDASGSSWNCFRLVQDFGKLLFIDYQCT